MHEQPTVERDVKSSATVRAPGTYNDLDRRDSMSLCTLLESVIHGAHLVHITTHQKTKAPLCNGHDRTTVCLACVSHPHRFREISVRGRHALVVIVAVRRPLDRILNLTTFSNAFLMIDPLLGVPRLWHHSMGTSGLASISNAFAMYALLQKRWRAR